MLHILMLAAAIAADAPSPGASAFEGYRKFNADEPLADWRVVNETVRDVGGHLGILRSGKAAPGKAEPGKAAAPAKATAPEKSPVADPHAGHGRSQPPAEPKR